MSSQKSASSRKTGIIVGAVAAAAVTAAAFAGAGGVIQLPGMSGEAQLPLTRISTTPLFQPPPGAPLSFADIFERVSPAVVSIHVTSKVPLAQAQMQFPGFPGFPFDPEAAPQAPGGRAAPPREARSSGSGFFISADGYIVTNNHVIENATEIEIVMTDKRKLKATVIGTDEATDLAVLKVEGRNFPFVNFENSAKPRVGDWVITIGNPFDLGGTATAGIVSAYARQIPDESSNFVDFLQIDAAINRGNSGGPTFDVYGRVIGVNSAIYSPNREGGSVGIGFAIPADVADDITKRLINGGKITRGFLGATVSAYTEELAQGQGEDFPGGGAFVQGVTEGGPAATAGLRPGDVVLSVNGNKVADSTALTRMVAGSRTGDTLRLEVLREGKTRIIAVRSGVRPSEGDLRGGLNGERDPATPGGRRGGEEPSVVRPNVLGMSVAPIDDALRRRFSLAEDVAGVVIVGVDDTSPAAGILRPGDVIRMARGAPISTPAQLNAAVEAQRRANRKTVLLLVQRQRDSQSLLLDLEKKAEEE